MRTQSNLAAAGPPRQRRSTFGYCIDGGVYANNPGCMAIASALNSGVALSDIVMLSIGTGANPENVQVSPPPTNYGSLMWMLPLPYGSMPASPSFRFLWTESRAPMRLSASNSLGRGLSACKCPLRPRCRLMIIRTFRNLSALLRIT
jgi:hypothetical protein